MSDIDEAEGKGEGFKFTMWLFAMYSGLKGFYSQGITNTMSPFLRDELELDNVWVSEWSNFKRLPWNLKPGYAFLSDVQPFCGYKKRFYVFVFGMIGFLALPLLIFLPNQTLADMFRPETGTLAGILFFLCHVNASAVDTLTQGRYTVLVKAVGASVVTFVYFNQNAAQMIVTSYSGPLNDINPRLNLWVAVPFGLQMFVFAGLNYLGDPPAQTTCKPEMELVRRQRPTFILAIFQVLVSTIWGLMSLFDGLKFLFGESTRLWFSLISSALIVISAFYALPPMIAKCNMYMYMCKFMQLSASSALFFFYTAPRDKDKWAACPNNPGLDYTLYQTYGGFMNKAVVLAAIVLFQMYIQHWNARKAMWITTTFTILAAFFDIAIVERWNLAFGIPDWLGYLLGSVAIEGLVDQLDDMPIYMLISKICPKDIETTVFAILTANTNLGGNAAGFIATDVQRWLGLEYSKKTCSNPEYTVFGMKFTALSWILIIGDVILPALTIPLTFLLIPDVKLSDDWVASMDSDLGVREIQMSSAADFEAGLNQGEPPAQPLRKGSSALLQEQSGAETVMTTLAYTRGNSKIDKDVL